MKPIYQVANKGGNPASREGNEDAIFLSYEKAQEHINFLIEDCGLHDMEFKIIDLTNDFESWHETHFEIVNAISLQYERDKDGMSKSSQVNEEFGHGGLYEWAKKLTDEFEKEHEGKEWGIDEDTDYNYEIEAFVNANIYK